MRQIAYRSQRHNYDWGGKLSAYIQCFYTSAFMFLSFWNHEYDATNDDQYNQYVDDVETLVGKPGIGERVMHGLGLTGRSGKYYAVHQAALQERIPDREVIFGEGFPIEQLPEILLKGPVIIGTSKLGRLPDGHIILLNDYDKKLDIFSSNDPYGDATSNYITANGKDVPYRKLFLVPHIDTGLMYSNRPNGKCNIIYAR